MPRNNSAKVIINARSGIGEKEKARRRVEEVFRASGIACDISSAQSGAEVAELARKAATGAAIVSTRGRSGVLRRLDSNQTFLVTPRFLSFTDSLQKRVKAYEDCALTGLGKMETAGFYAPEQSPLSYVRRDRRLFDAH